MRGFGYSGADALVQKLRTAVRLFKELNRVPSIDANVDHLRAQVDENLRLLSKLLEREPLSSFYGKKVAIYLDGVGRPCFTLDRGAAAKSAVVVSVPKSGTYLVAAYLEKLGLASTGAHLSEDAFTDYRGRSIKEMVELGARLNVALPLAQSLSMIQPGQFAVGHLVHSEETAALLRDFTVIFTYRELRASLVSAMRFFENEGRGDDFGTVEWKAVENQKARMAAFARIYFPNYLGYMAGVVPWITAAGIAKVRFETIVGDDTPGQQEAAIALGTAVGSDVEEGRRLDLLKSCIGAPTKTWSGSRSSVEQYWSDEVEAMFEAGGGSMLNATLGYAS